MLHIQRVSSGQLQALQQISRETFVEAFAHENTPEDMQHYLENNFGDAQLTSELNEPDSTFFFAIIHNEIVGYLKVNCGAAQHELKDCNTLEVERIYILKKHYGSQVGQRLLQYAFTIAEEMQAEFTWLAVWEKNFRAIRFYEKNGFTPFGTHDFILGKDIQTDILMKRSLSTTR